MTKDNQSIWKIDSSHSGIQFKVKHLGISNVTGTFKLFEGDVINETDDFDNAKVHCVINAESLDTNNTQRDKDLKSEGFFDTQKFPEIEFDGQLKKKDNNYQLEGKLAIRQIVNPILMEAEFTGTGKGRFNDTRAGFEVTGKINRKDFGLSWNILTQAGGFIIGEEIKLYFDIQLIKQ